MSALDLLGDISREDFAYMHLSFFTELCWTEALREVREGPDGASAHEGLIWELLETRRLKKAFKKYQDVFPLVRVDNMSLAQLRVLQSVSAEEAWNYGRLSHLIHSLKSA